MKFLEILNIPLVSNLSSGIIILVLGLLAVQLLAKGLEKFLSRSKMEKAAHSLILSLAKVVLYLLVGLSAASALGIDVTGIVALASVLTLALSLALQDMVSNVIGGFTILYTKPFRSGDFVDIGGQSGTVQEITMTYTKLATFDNKLVFLPNKSVTAAQIINYTVTGTRRLDVNVSASYDTPTQKVLDALTVVSTLDDILLEPAPSAVILGFGENAIQYSLRVWVKTEHYWDVNFELNQKIKKIFDEQGIRMACPRLKVQLDQTV